MHQSLLDENGLLDPDDALLVLLLEIDEVVLRDVADCDSVDDGLHLAEEVEDAPGPEVLGPRVARLLAAVGSEQDKRILRGQGRYRCSDKR